MFSEIIWPYLKKYIGLPIAKQTLDSLYCIIQVHSRYPKLIDGAFIPRVLETGTELFCTESMNDIAKILIFVRIFVLLTFSTYVFTNYIAFVSSTFPLWKHLSTLCMKPFQLR